MARRRRHWSAFSAVVIPFLGIPAGIQPQSAAAVVDHANKAFNARSATISSSCTVLGDGQDGRADGLHFVSGVAQLRDGTLFVVNAGTGELLMYDQRGRYVRSLTRPGSGPGELTRSTMNAPRALGIAVLPGDSIAVYDRALQRVSVFDRSGRYARSFMLASGIAANRTTFLVGAGSTSGDLVFGELTTRRGTQPAGRIEFIDSTSIFRVSGTGSPVWLNRGLPNAPLQMEVVHVPGGRGIQSRQVGTSRLSPVVVAGDFVVHYVAAAHELQLYDRRGQVVRRIRLPRMPNPNAQRVQALALIADERGNIWFEVPMSAGPERSWWVFESTGEMAASVLTPARHTPLLIRAGSILLRTVGRDDEQVIRVCDLNFGRG